MMGVRSCVVVNGDVVAQVSQLFFKDVEVWVGQVDLDAFRRGKVAF